MERITRAMSTWPESVSLAVRGLRTLTARQWGVATVTAIGFGLLLGLATVLIPNSIFVRDIPPVWWNYPVWILTSIFSGLLFATFIRDDATSKGEAQEASVDNGPHARRSSRFGMAGAFLAWFAVGCPVCNKFALLALGYSGAITWFAPVQPVLAVVALILTSVALVVRLRGRIVCALPPARVTEAAT